MDWRKDYEIASMEYSDESAQWYCMVEGEYAGAVSNM